MTQRGRIAPGGSQPLVVTTSDKCDLRRILDDAVQAVICMPEPLPGWLGPLGDAIEQGSAVAKRSVLPDGSREEVRTWFDTYLDEVLPVGAVEPFVREHLMEDVLELVDLMTTLSGVSRFRLRVLIGTPNTECGFHVDTVEPAAPPWGLLRVYNGAGTHYADPRSVRSLAAFHHYLARRERLERSRDDARRHADDLTIVRVETEIADLDGALSFLEQPDSVHLAPAGSIIAFRHTDIRDHWSNENPRPGWIHSSPMGGSPRLVINVTSPQWARGIEWRTATARQN